MKLKDRLAALLLTASVVFASAANAGVKNVPVSDGPRQSILLDGTGWETAVGRDPFGSDATSWSAVSVPNQQWVTPDWHPRYVWYRRNIVVPADWIGRRVFLIAEGAKYAPAIFVDGKVAGSQFDGWAPLRTDITSLVSPGQRAVIEIRCEDQTATIAPEALNNVTAGADPSQGHTIGPVGGFRPLIGLWDSVVLESVPQSYIDESTLAIVTSVRDHLLTVRGKIGGAEKGWVDADVIDPITKAVVLHLPTAAIAADGAWTLAKVFPRARYWSPEDPYLYTIVVSYRPSGPDADPADRCSQSFGFKEIWTQGPFIYINGIKRALLGSAAWPAVDCLKPAEILSRVKLIRKSNAIIFRLHTGPWPQSWLDAADHAGLLIIDEGAIYTDDHGTYDYNDPRFWKNYQDEVVDMVRRDRNHPSLALYSLENEALFMGNQSRDPNLPKQLGNVARYVRSIDPAHPITFEADLDPDGAADIIGLHYPHELPWNIDYPNTCDWLNTGPTTAEAGGGLLGKMATSGFRWNRAKPLYIGEYLWDPQNDFSDSSIFYGDSAFLNQNKYKSLTQMTAFREQTLAYRFDGLSGMCPWTIFGFGATKLSDDFYKNQQEFYKPVVAYCRDLSPRCYSGEHRVLTYNLLNDGGAAVVTRLRISRPNGTVLTSISTPLAPGDHKAVQFTVDIPNVSTITPFPIKAAFDAGRGSFTSLPDMPLRVFPRTPLHAPEGFKVIYYDPLQKWPGSTASLSKVDSLDPRSTIIVIAPFALGKRTIDQTKAIADSKFDSNSFLSFLSRGGRALVMQQRSVDCLGLGLKLVRQGSTMSFPLRSSSELWRNLQPGDLEFWRPDNYVSQYQFYRPESGGGISEVVTGSQAELGTTPYLDLPYGQNGRIIFMQLSVNSPSDPDPASLTTLQNALDALAAPPMIRGETIAASADANFVTRLASLGLITKSVSSVDSMTLSNAHVLALRGQAPPEVQAGAISDLLNRGGVVYWSDPDSTSLAALSEVLGPQARQVLPVPAMLGTAILDRRSQLLDGVSREDLTYDKVSTDWTRGLTWEPDATDCIFVPTQSTGAPQALNLREAVLNNCNLSHASATPSVSFSHSGSLSLVASEPTAGLYALTIGNSCGQSAEKSPVVMVYVDDDFQTNFYAATALSPSTTTVVSLSKGLNKLTLEVNDGEAFAEGKSLLISSVKIAALTYPEGVDVLTTPASLICWKAGNGTVVLDGGAWLTNSDNETNANRYCNALFSNLGAAFGIPSAENGTSDVELPREFSGRSGVYSSSQRIAVTPRG